jgi:hypothetical protein
MKSILSRIFSYLALALLATPAMALPVINNNNGTWTDSYNDATVTITPVNTELNAPSGTVRLVTGQSTGTYDTVLIEPSSFSARGAFTLDSNYSAVGNVQVEVRDPLNGNAVILGPLAYGPGPIDLSSINPVTHPDLRFRITPTAGATRPTVSALKVTWTPKSALLLTKQAPAEVQAGQPISYRINYCTAYVPATDVAVYDTTPAMTYPVNFGQNDNLSFVSASFGGLFSVQMLATPTLVVPGKYQANTKSKHTREGEAA